MRKISHWLLDIPGKGPEDGRKRKLLATIAVFTIIFDIPIMIASELLYQFFRPDRFYELAQLRLGETVIIAFTILVYIINRKVSGSLASILLLISWMAALPFVDTPLEVSGGRSLFIFYIPVIISGMLLNPSASFWFAGLCSAMISVIAIVNGHLPNVPAIGGFFMIGLITWISTSSLEHARLALEQANRELDSRVTERTRELSESLERERAEAGKNQAILESINDGVVVLDNEGRAILANPAMEALVGGPAQTILGKRLPELLAGTELSQHDREALFNFFRKASSPSDRMIVEWGKQTLAISVSTVVIAEGVQIGRVAVFHNYTQQAELDRMKNDFVAMVSHELRTPLNSILGYVDMLREGVYGRPSGAQSGVLDRVTANTRRLLTLVNDLLDQAQIESGRMIFHYRQFNPNELLDHMNSTIEGFAADKGMELTARISNDLPRSLYGDPQRLGQVLVNLVNNAIKFTEKGFIAVRLFRLDADHWAMEVSDTGIGISPEAQRYIFDTFRKGNTEPAQRQGGIGLGLTIVKRLVTLMEGDLCVNSQVGKGSTFTVILPFIISQKEAVNDERSPTGVHHRG